VVEPTNAVVEPTDAALLAMADRQSAEFFRSAADRPWARVRVDPDVIHGTTGIPLPVFNGATNARFEATTADERIEAVLEPFRRERIDMTWWVGPTSTPDDLVDRLVAHGLVVDERVPVMGRSLEGLVAGSLRPGLEIELVVDGAGFHAATEVMKAGFGMPPDVAPEIEARYADYAIGPRAIQRVYLARQDGVAVATALGFVVDGVVGIYNVATRPEHRGRGAGSAVTAAALADAASHGAVAAILESSAMGRSLYERLGFRAIGSVTVLLGAFGSSGTGQP
jgi:ribosomal protein S18 acetylase RimI-like enzyme